MLEIRSPTPSDTAALLGIAVSTGLFSEEEADGLLGAVLRNFNHGKLPGGHQVSLAASEGGAVEGWVYFAPDPHISGVWNLWWIGVAPVYQGSGAGAELLHHVEMAVKKAGARILVVETSSDDALTRARRFYVREGYSECGRIPDFYSEGEAKIIFVKQLRPADPATD